MNTNPKTVALNAFEDAIGEIQSELRELQSFIDDRMGFGPDDIGWDEANATGYLLKKLTALADMAYEMGGDCERPE